MLIYYRNSDEDHMNHRHYSACGRLEGNKVLTTYFFCCDLWIKKPKEQQFQTKLKSAAQSFRTSSVYTHSHTDWRMNEPLLRNEMLMCQEAAHVVNIKYDHKKKKNNKKNNQCNDQRFNCRSNKYSSSTKTLPTPSECTDKRFLKVFFSKSSHTLHCFHCFILFFHFFRKKKTRYKGIVFKWAGQNSQIGRLLKSARWNHPAWNTPILKKMANDTTR